MAKDDGIDLVNLSNLPCPNTFYVNNTTDLLNLTAGTTFSLYSKANTSSIFPAPFYIAVWIDSNRNGVFSSNEKVYQSNYPLATSTNNTTNGTFDLPSNSIAGITRMRIVTNQSSNPCIGVFLQEILK